MLTNHDYDKEETNMYKGTISFRDSISCIIGCDRCNLHITRTNIVLYRGNPKSNIMVIGEGPGRLENEKGIPMVGPTGSYLVRLLEQNGLSLYDYFITNSVLCMVPNNGDPTPNQLNACSDWFNMIIDLVNPIYIITVGRISSERLIPQFATGDLKITREGVEGASFTSPNLRGKVIIPIRHPSFIMKDLPNREESYKENISNIVSKCKTGHSL